MKRTDVALLCASLAPFVGVHGVGHLIHRRRRAGLARLAAGLALAAMAVGVAYWLYMMYVVSIAVYSLMVWQGSPGAVPPSPYDPWLVAWGAVALLIYLALWVEGVTFAWRRRRAETTAQVTPAEPDTRTT